MNELTTFFVLAFSTLFTLINPIGLTAVYLSIVENYEAKERKRIALKGSFTAFIILIIFSLMGDIIFSFYGITVSAFKIAGGILFFNTGIQMLEARVSRSRSTPKEEEEAKKYDDFFAVLNNLPDELDESLKFRGIAADDILTFVVDKLSINYEHTWIIISDRDLYQLIDNNVSVYNIFGRKEITKDILQETFDVTPDEYLLSRIIEGDKSDNIQGVEGIGPKRAQGLAREYKTLEALIEAFPINGRAKYIHNLNMSKDILYRNEKLVNLKKYNLDALTSGKYGDEPLDVLSAL